MTEIPFIPSMRPEPKRDDYGRYVLPDLNGVQRSWTRATTVAHALDDEFHLTQWKRRMVLSGAALRPGLLANVPELTRALVQAGDDWRVAKDIKRELDGLCDEAAEAAGAGDGAKLGTLLHTITEYYDADRIDEIDILIPEALVEDVREYARVMDGAGLGRPAEFIERIVVNSRVDSAGTFDRLLRLPDGRLVVGDLKTQKTVDFGFLSIAIQLAEYAQADAMLDDEAGTLVPLPAELDRSVGIVMHLPVGQATCTLYELDLDRRLGRRPDPPTRCGTATSARRAWAGRTSPARAGRRPGARPHPLGRPPRRAGRAVPRPQPAREWTDGAHPGRGRAQGRAGRHGLNPPLGRRTENPSSDQGEQMPIGVSSAPYAKFTKPGDRHGGEIVDFRVVQTVDFDSKRPQYLQQNEDGWSQASLPTAPTASPTTRSPSGRSPSTPGVEDENGDTERRIFVDPRKGRRNTLLEGKRGGDAVAIALKKAKAHRVGLEIGATFYLISGDKVRDGSGPPPTPGPPSTSRPPVAPVPASRSTRCRGWSAVAATTSRPRWPSGRPGRCPRCARP
jgi:hypothetical protein